MVGLKDYERLMKQRPHVVLLGAGATMAAIPNGDKNGKKSSVMSGFIEKLNMKDILSGANLKTTSDNLEDIYSELSSSEQHKDICKELEKRIYDYFSAFQIPDEPTVYDFLLLSLTSKDLIATFNWDPLLLQAYQRVSKITSNLPELAFLHGNVMVGVCHDHKRGGTISARCPECNKLFSSIKLLYPVGEKNYDSDLYISDSWNFLRKYLDRAYMFTIFGYSAPVSDKSAIDLLKTAWGSLEERSLEEVEIINPGDENKLRERWDAFIHTHHYSVHTNLFDSSLGKLPRRSCEATFDRLMNVRWLDGSKGFKENMTFDEISDYLKPLIEDEQCNRGILNNPYLA